VHVVSSAFSQSHADVTARHHGLLRRPQQIASAGAPRDRDLREFVKELAAFAVRQAEPLVLQDEGGVGVRTQLAGRGAQSITTWKRMTTLRAFPGATT
jgi:hypothetical protein